MVVVNVKKLGIAQEFSIYAHIYIYFFVYLSNLLIYLLKNAHFTIVYGGKILSYSLCWIVSKVSGSVAMATRNHSRNGAHTRSEHIKTALGIGLPTRPRLISVSSRYMFAWNIYRHRVSLA